MAHKEVTDIDSSQFDRGVIYGFHKGFKAHQELSKDKVFTVEDMRKAIKKSLYYWNQNANTESAAISDILQSVSPKTEWNVTFDEQGKLKLI